MGNSTVSPYLGKTLTKVIGAQYAFEKAVIMRKSLSKLDLESREICGDILNELESYSIDMQDEYWLDFNNAIRTKLEEEGVTCSPRQPIKQKRKNQLHELIGKVYLSLCDRGRKPTAKDVWAEIEKNYEDYDDECIIQEVTDEYIFWKSTGGSNQKLHRKSFDPVLSKIKKKLSLTTKF